MISNIHEEDDDIEWLGKDSNAPYLAFGDDSCFKEILLYAFVVIERDNYQSMKQEVIELKRRLNIPIELPIHTKDFLNGHMRKKLEIEYLNVGAMIDKIFELINNSTCIIIYNYAVVPETGSIHSDDLEIAGQKIHGDRKAHAHVLASSCFCPFIEYRGGHLNLRQFEVFVSQEKTKVKTVGNKKRQAQFMSELRIPLTLPIQKGSYARLKPHYVPTNDYLFCQIADVYAYVLSHALSKKNKNPNFKKQMRRIKHLFRSPAG